MPIEVNGKNASFTRLTLNLDDLPKFHWKGWYGSKPTIPEMEHIARQLVRRKFAEDLTKEFIGKVCDWGGSRVKGKVLGKNKPKELSEAMRKAHDLLNKNRLKDALISLSNLYGLGVSYASKHLRFLSPNKCVILDKIISDRPGYPQTPCGYELFVQDCRKLLKLVDDANIVRMDNEKFRVSDIETAIYNILKPW